MTLVRHALAWLARLFARWSGGEAGATTPALVGGSPLEPRVRLHLDRVRTLRWTNLEAMLFKRRTGIDLWRDSIQPLDWEIEHFMEFLAVACGEEDPGVTAEQLAPAIAGQTVTDAMAAVMILLGEWVPQAPAEAGDAEGDGNPQTASARNPSTPNRTGRSPHRRGGSPIRNTGD